MVIFVVHIHSFIHSFITLMFPRTSAVTEALGLNLTGLSALNFTSAAPGIVCSLKYTKIGYYILRDALEFINLF